MAVQARRVSKTRKRKKRTHQGAKLPTTKMCNNCGQVIKPHMVCKYCGFYKDKEIIKTKDTK